VGSEMCIRDRGKVVREAQVGLLVDPADPVQVTKAIQRLLKDEGLRRTFSEHGLRAAKEQYNWERESSKLERVYPDLV